MKHVCLLCQKEIDNPNSDSLLNYCDSCSKLLILKNPKKIKITKEEKKKRRIEKIVKTLSKDNPTFYKWDKNKPQGGLQKEIVNYLLSKYPNEIPFPEVIESIIMDEVIKMDKNGKERYITFAKVLNLFKGLESREIIKKV